LCIGSDLGTCDTEGVPLGFSTRVILEDNFHAEWNGEFLDMEAAVAELKRRANLPWNQSPNRPPCEDWETCHREYHIVAYDTSKTPWQELSRTRALNVDSSGIRWSEEAIALGYAN